MDKCSDYKDNILKRLRRIEGQVKGIQKMIQDEKYCVDILVQIAAVRAAINKVGGLVVENYTKECVQKAVSDKGSDQTIEELMNVILKFIK